MRKRPAPPRATGHPPRTTNAPKNAPQRAYSAPPRVLVLEGAPASGTNSKRLIKRGVRRFLVPSKAATTWKAGMVAQLQAAWRAAPITDLLAVTLHVYRARNTGDTDNFAKPVLDAMQAAGVLCDDKIVTELHLYRTLDRTRPRVVITLHAPTPLLEVA